MVARPAGERPFVASRSPHEARGHASRFEARRSTTEGASPVTSEDERVDEHPRVATRRRTSRGSPRPRTARSCSDCRGRSSSSASRSCRSSTSSWRSLVRNADLDQVISVSDGIYILIFAVDFARRWRVATDPRRYFTKGKGWLDFISIIPLLRIARVLRIVRVIRMLAADGRTGARHQGVLRRPGCGRPAPRHPHRHDRLRVRQPRGPGGGAHETRTRTSRPPAIRCGTRS